MGKPVLADHPCAGTRHLNYLQVQVLILECHGFPQVSVVNYRTGWPTCPASRCIEKGHCEVVSKSKLARRFTCMPHYRVTALHSPLQFLPCHPLQAPSSLASCPLPAWHAQELRRSCHGTPCADGTSGAGTVRPPNPPSPSVGEVRSQTDWDPVWTGPNPVVLVLVWDFPKNMGPLGLRSGQFHIA